MAVPKRKTSKARRDSRRANNFKLETPNLVECPKCHELKLPHVVCKKCGCRTDLIAPSIEYAAKDKAISEWNKRVND